MITKRPMTAEDLLRMPADENSYELVNGELRMMTPAGFEHGQIAMRFGLYILQHVQKNDLGAVLAAETGFALARDPDTVRAPDVAFVSKPRIPPKEAQKKFAELAPDLVVEVVSPNETSSDIGEKIQDYLGAGVRLIWVVYPETKTIREYRSRTEIKTLTRDDELQGYDVLPGFTCPIAKLFE